MPKIILFNDKKDCCGCGACFNICPKGAISMKQDDRGFLYPEIDDDKCVQCGMCNKVCAYKNGAEKVEDKQACYAFTNNNIDELNRSSSGGAFSAIVDAIYSMDGDNITVYGTIIDSEMNIMHKSASERTDCNAFCTSKYVQSNMNDCFKQVETNLKDGKAVLYTGTPCQIAAVRSYVSKKNINDENLFLVDIICHGTPSPGLWKNYVSWMEKKFGKMKEFSFRYKAAGWRGYPAMAKFENGKELVYDQYTQVFTNLFFTHKALRESCYSCQYANMNRPGDLTIGDYWGAETILKNEIDAGTFVQKKGISEIIVNSSKGSKLMNKIMEGKSCVLSETDAYIKYQHNLNAPTERPEGTDRLWDEYNTNGADFVIKKYGKPRLKQRIKMMIPPNVKEGIKKIIRK
ncbi:Coenzyme F420 hydrogenase/dehydrogenase, beta subunit C-terminal domain [Faecalicatena contorta]|uniref:Coenzyme F420-reducing hydrogenase, beta subunit n=1 Tax=Faecalicatena contorta TaxID=39482 RepID=A0A316A3Q0_9FIRM|nr:Coenzyme F420 hydrogenase/dehydrogenase, beta subunit C-terminal domain [Faecalicatena contorta]PWJ51570.1 coenzyme F420-reducing hydrogenase beta subunit [Faecalicatena contorta]SUQ13126.1 Coenzyme F420-reducing hydrogenase, beta subunit [Faecalicatena contorta]